MSIMQWLPKVNQILRDMWTFSSLEYTCHRLLVIFLQQLRISIAVNEIRGVDSKILSGTK